MKRDVRAIIRASKPQTLMQNHEILGKSRKERTEEDESKKNFGDAYGRRAAAWNGGRMRKLGNDEQYFWRYGQHDNRRHNGQHR